MPPRPPSGRRSPPTTGATPDTPIGSVRIIGGKMRGRVLPLLSDPNVRPMKDRIREAVFNLLADHIRGKNVLDLFAGTGVLGFEAISRGASTAMLLERHFPTARQIARNADELGISSQVRVEATDAFVWVRRLAEGTLMAADGTTRDELATLRTAPWVVFCSPPYALYVSRREDLLHLIETLAGLAPTDSVIVVESDERFDPALLPDATTWTVRTYPPATIALWRKNS